MAIKHIVLSGGGSMCFTIQGILSKTNELRIWNYDNLKTLNNKNENFFLNDSD